MKQDISEKDGGFNLKGNKGHNGMVKLYIKNMVCHRCKMAVETTLLNLDLHPASIVLGEAVLTEEVLSKDKKAAVDKALHQLGFELMDDKKSLLLEQIKLFIIDTIHYKDIAPTQNFSHLLSRHLQHDYSFLSKLFSDVEGVTIEQYLLQQKIEKVKELLHYNELPLSQIAFDLGYSSTAHLSAQFKKLTGLTTTQFKKNGTHGRKSLDEIGKS